MAKNSNDYDSVFKTLKKRHQRLFISVINLAFGKNYPMDAKVDLLPTDGQFVIPDDEDVDIEDRDSDLIMVVQGDKYLVECQSYDDDTMAIRIAEYAFISARDTVDDRNGRMIFRMPDYVVLYVKSGKNTPEYTKISFEFPNGESVEYDSKNIFISDYSREKIIKEGLYVFIPFFITRYADTLSKSKGTAGSKKVDASRDAVISQAEADLDYFAKELDRLFQEGVLTGEENVNLRVFTKKVITHITDGNDYEERMVKKMGGQILETESERLRREGREEGREKGREEMRKEMSLYYDGQLLAKDNLLAAMAQENERLKSELERLNGAKL